MTGIADLLARFMLAVDDHDWDAVTACLADEVRRDYSSLSGAGPDTIAGAALAAEWAGVLGGLDAHQHLLGPPVIDGERAAVHVVGTHVREGEPPWVVGGTYRLEVRGGRIEAITLQVRWQTGDPGILQR